MSRKLSNECGGAASFQAIVETRRPRPPGAQKQDSLAPCVERFQLTERIRLVKDDFIENQVTIEDPEYLTKPWTWTWMYKRWPGYKIQEYVCEDNRYFEDPGLGYQRLRVQ